MHDIDRTQHEYGEMGFESTYGETPLGEIFGESSYGEQESYESYEGYGMGELSEEEVMELAAELLEVQSEEEIDEFLGKIFKKVGKAVGGIAKKVVPAIAPVLKGVVKQALPVLKQAAGAAIPMAAGALGTAFGGPVGGMIGSKLGSAATGLFGLELEGMSAEDREFAGAQQVVKLAEQAVKQAAQAGGGQQAIQSAVTNAASQFMPGLLRPQNQQSGQQQQGQGQGPRGGGGGRRSGRWIRQGNKIILLGV